MYFSLRPLTLSPPHDNPSMMIAMLAALLIAGPLIYAAMLFILWGLWRRPAGPELLLLEWLQPRMPVRLRGLAQRLMPHAASEPK